MINQNTNDKINVIAVKITVRNKLSNGAIVIKKIATKNTNGINLTIAVLNSLCNCLIIILSSQIISVISSINLHS